MPEEWQIFPQFVRDGKLALISETLESSLIQQFDIITGEPDESFDVVEIPISRRRHQLMPAIDGGIWLLEEALPDFWAPPNEFRLRHLLADGRDHPEFLPQEFDGSYGSMVSTSEDGSFAIVYHSVHQPWEPSNVMRISFHDPMGTVTSNLRPWGVGPFLPFSDGSAIMMDAGFTDRGPRNGDHDPLRPGLWRQLVDYSTDPGFHYGGKASTLRRLSDGRILVNGNDRILENGAPDPEWKSPELLKDGIISQFWSGPNGTVYGAGQFSKVDGYPRPNFSRWLADGSLDLSFVPEMDSGSVEDLVSLSDGRVYVIRKYSDAVSVLQRYLPDGAIDDSFVMKTGISNAYKEGDIERIELFPNEDLLASFLKPGEVRSLHVVRIDSGGNTESLLPVKYRHSLDLMVLSDGRFFHDGHRYLEDGSIDPAFNPSVDVQGVPVCRSGDGWLFALSHYSSKIIRLNDNGAIDPTFESGTLAVWDNFAATGSNGMFYKTIHSWNPDHLIDRFFANGQLDPSFRSERAEMRNVGIPSDLPVLGQTPDFPAGFAAYVHPETHEVWLGGRFSAIGNQRRSGIARLDGSIPRTYDQWAGSIFELGEAHDRAADPDEDGASNQVEFAAGTDPLHGDDFPQLKVIISDDVSSIVVPLNSAATGITATLEVSSDLQRWTVATEDQAIRQNNSVSLVYVLHSDRQNDYWRARYSIE